MCGFDEIFEPYMLEETDMVDRGLKRGWKIVYAPDTKPLHKCGGTIDSKKINIRNFFLNGTESYLFGKILFQNLFLLVTFSGYYYVQISRY